MSRPRTISDVWTSLTSADRYAMLGHDRDELDPAEEAKLAKVVANLRKKQLNQAG